MPTNNGTRALPDPGKVAPAFDEIRNERDARLAFAAFLDDEQEIKTAAATFVKLGSRLAGRTASGAERYRLYRRL